MKTDNDDKASNRNPEEVSSDISAMEERIADGLASRGYCIVENFLSPEDVHALQSDFAEHLVAGRFQHAGIGQGSIHQLATDIRRDRTLWLEPSHLTPA